MRTPLALAPLLLLIACSRVDPIPDAEKAEIDCLSSITVVNITDTIRDGTLNGMGPSELSGVVPANIAKALATFDAKYDGEIDEAYLEFEINNRLQKFETALETGDENSLEYLSMTETLDLGRSCKFGE